MSQAALNHAVSLGSFLNLRCAMWSASCLSLCIVMISSTWRGNKEVEWQKQEVSKELMAKETERSRPLRLDDKGAVCLNRIASLVERDRLIEVEHECDPGYVQIVLTRSGLDNPEVKGLTSPGVVDKDLGMI